MKKSIRALSLVIVFCMLATLLPAVGNRSFTVYADGDFTVENGVLTGYNGPGGDVAVPDGVTAIGNNAFEGCEELTHVTLPGGVVSIGDEAFLDCTGLTGVTLPGSLTSVGELAFSGCSSLADISVPAGVTTIGENAFLDCASLTAIHVAAGNQVYSSVDGVLFAGNMTVLIRYPMAKTGTSYSVPSDVNEIACSAFNGCSRLETITLPEGLGQIGELAFAGCSGLTGIDIPSGVEVIPAAAFEECSSMTHVGLPYGLTLVEKGAFAGCQSLRELWFPSGLMIIEDWAFEACASLTRVTIPQDVMFVGESAFSSCRSLAEVTILALSPELGVNVFLDSPVETVNYVGNDTEWDASGWNDCFASSPNVNYCYGEESEDFIIEDGVVIGYQGAGGDIVIPLGVTAIGEQAFFGCDNLTGVTVPDGVTSIGSGAFGDCHSLTSVTLSGSVASIGSGAFAYCTSLQSLNLTYGLVTIGESAFGDCSSLATVTVPGSVTAIGDSAFNSCTSLHSLTLMNGIVSIGSGAFGGCEALDEVSIPASVLSIGEDAFGHCSSLAVINVAGANPNFSSEGGVLFDRNKTAIIRYPQAKSGTSYSIPSGVMSIAGYAFSECNALVNVTIPQSVTSVGDFAFYWCSSLRTADLPSDVTSIGEGAFSSCTSLRSMTIPQGVTVINRALFNFCTSLTSVTILQGVTAILDYSFTDCTSLTTIEIPDSVEEIGVAAFQNCLSLTGIEIPSGVQVIGDRAFASCDRLSTVTILAKSPFVGRNVFVDSPVATVNYAGAETEWNASGWKSAFGSAVTVNYNYGAPVQPITITTQPQDVTVELGKKAIFTVAAEGEGLTYQWYYVRAGKTVWNVWNGRTSATASVTTTASWDGTKVYCKITDADGNTVDSATATVTLTAPAITITTQPQDVTVELGKKAIFTVAAEGEGLTYQWYYVRAGKTVWNVWNGRTSATASVTTTASWDGTKVYCKITDADGNTLDSAAATVTLTAPAITITTQPQDVTVELGQKAIFTVAAEGEGLTYQWYYMKKTESKWNVWNGRTSATASITTIASWDGAKVYCRITDADGNTLDSGIATVTLS